MDTNRARIAIATLVTVATYLLLDLVLPWNSTSLIAVLVRMSLITVAVCAIGGYIAVGSFIVPAIILAALTWIATTAYSMYLGLDFGDVSFDRLVWNLPNAVLVPAAAIGAKIGSIMAVRGGRSSVAES